MMDHRRSKYKGSFSTRKKVTGKHVIPYIMRAALCNSFWRTKKCAAQNENNIAAIDVKREDNPSRSFHGKSYLKSFSWHLEVRIARKKTRAVTEKQRATRDVMENALNAGWPLKTGMPLFSSKPPGTVEDVANATGAMSAATTEHDFDVLKSHSLPSFTNFSCVLVRIILAVSPFLLTLC
jgi:hypothetical protein